MATATSMLKNAAKKSNLDPHAEIEDIEEHLQKLTAEIASLSRTLTDYGNGRLSEVSRDARQMKDQLSEKSSAVAQAAKDGMLSMEGELEEKIRTRPLAAIGIAVGLGFLMAHLTRR